MLRISGLLLLMLGFANFALAQNFSGSVKGTVKDGAEKTIESATITLQNVADSAIVKYTVAEKSGAYKFENLKEGEYFVSVSAIGHAPASTDAFSINSNNPSITLEVIELMPVSTSLDAVVVTAKKPVIEMKAGKMLVNVDASPSNEGLNALELLEKSPGITVDNDGNISLKGKTGVMILVDGKPTYMSGPDLAALLKSMPSSALEQLEIMTNPPAKYDAAGNAGIINIKTKKGRTRGLNGSLNAGFTQGFYSRYNTSLNLNYRNDKLNIFGGLNHGSWAGYNRLVIDRNFYQPGSSIIDRTIDQVSRPEFRGHYNGLKAGVDYNLTKRDIMGVVFNYNFNNGEETPTSLTNIREANGQMLSYLLSSSDNTSHSDNFTGNFNYKHSFDSTGREISVDLDYAQYMNHNMTSLLTKSFSP